MQTERGRDTPRSPDRETGGSRPLYFFGPESQSFRFTFQKNTHIPYAKIVIIYPYAAA